MSKPYLCWCVDWDLWIASNSEVPGAVGFGKTITEALSSMMVEEQVCQEMIEHGYSVKEAIKIDLSKVAKPQGGSY